MRSGRPEVRKGEQRPYRLRGSMRGRRDRKPEITKNDRHASSAGRKVVRTRSWAAAIPDTAPWTQETPPMEKARRPSSEGMRFSPQVSGGATPNSSCLRGGCPDETAVRSRRIGDGRRERRVAIVEPRRSPGAGRLGEGSGTCSKKDVPPDRRRSPTVRTTRPRGSPTTAQLHSLAGRGSATGPVAVLCEPSSWPALCISRT